MKKKKLLFAACIAATLAVSAVGFTSCDVMGTLSKYLPFLGSSSENPDETTAQPITWDVDAKAGVKVEGYTALPAEVNKGTELTFTVEIPAGYRAKVTVNGSAQTAENGKYTVKINRKSTIKVALEEIVASLTVVGPEKPVYYAGETIAKEDYTVTAHYETGREEAIENYTVNYGGEGGFAIGDTEFTIEYQGVKSETIALGQAVEAKITIDALGGEIDPSVLEAYSARTDIKNYSVDENGVISFTYSALSEELVLPTAEQVTKGKEGDFTYVGWYHVVENGEDEEPTATQYTSVTKENGISLNLTLKWDAALVIVNSMRFSETDAEGNPGAYLVLNVSFKAVDSAYLYLYEGNDKVELKGDTYTASGNESDDLYFNCSILGDYQDGDYVSKWMDVCFNAVIDGQEYSQSFALDHEYPIAEIGHSIQDANNSYSLLTYRSAGKDYIKLAFKKYESTYGFNFHDDTLTVSGKINTNLSKDFATEYAGAKASLTISGVTASGDVAADGSWAIDFKLKDLPACGATTFSNLTVTKTTGEGDAAVETQLLSAQLYYAEGTTPYEFDGGLFGNPSYYSTKYEYGAFAYYVGYMGSDWQTAFYSIVDVGHAINYNDVTLTTDENGLYMVFTGTYGSSYNAEEAKKAITEKFYADLQVYPSWAMRWYSTDVIGEGDNATSVLTVETNEDGTFRVICNISNAQFADGDILYGHFGSGTSNMSVAYTETTVEYNGLVYTMGGANASCASWMNGLTIIYVTAPEVSA